MFVNPEISLQSLPDIETPEWHKLSARYARRLQVQNIIGVLVFAAAATLANFIPGVLFFPIMLLWSLVLVIAIVSVVRPMVVVPKKGYVLRDRDIVFRSGVIWRSVTAIPFNRIQHVETSSDPLDRKFELATLQIFTAGGSGGDLKINGLEKEVAEQLRMFILEKVGVSIEAG